MAVLTTLMLLGGLKMCVQGERASLNCEKIWVREAMESGEIHGLTDPSCYLLIYQSGLLGYAVVTNTLNLGILTKA